MLFPIRLDDAVMEADKAWAADIRRTRPVGDFSGWKQRDNYKKAFERLMRDLRQKRRREGELLAGGAESVRGAGLLLNLFLPLPSRTLSIWILLCFSR